MSNCVNLATLQPNDTVYFNSNLYKMFFRNHSLSPKACCLFKLPSIGHSAHSCFPSTWKTQALGLFQSQKKKKMGWN